ncbi:PTS sugar transporter subunit IIA [Desulfatiferula olefinivorans]
MKLELTELADCLKLPVYTVERWIRQGRIPARKTGNQCVFKRVVLEKWAEKHEIRFTLTETPSNTASDAGAEESLFHAIRRGGVHATVGGSTAHGVLEDAVSRIPGFTDEDRSLLLSKLIERENLVSTGIGKGVAIPHPRSPLSGHSRPPLIAVCFLDRPIDFKSLDGRPVSVMFVLVAPTVQAHLHLLSRISYCLRDDDFVNLLHGFPAEDVLLEQVLAFERRLDKAGQ